MGKYQCIIPVMVLLLMTLVTVSLAARTPNSSAMKIGGNGQLAKPTARILKSSSDGDDFEKKSDSCQAKLNKGAPDCFQDVYFKSKLPSDHGECCKNYLKMDKSAHDCWDYLFDDPETTFNFQVNFGKCLLLG